MKFLHKYGTRRNEIQRAKKELYFRLSLVVAALVFFALMVLITRFKPRLENQTTSSGEIVSDTPNVSKLVELTTLRKQVDNACAEYLALIEQGGNEVEAIPALDKAIQLQAQVIRSRTGEIASKSDLARMDQLQSTKDEMMGTHLMAQSAQRQEEAMKAMEEGNIDEAIRLLTKSIQIQKEINEQYSRSSSRNPTRLHELSKLILQWQTKPIAKLADQLKDDAYRLVDSGDYEEARTLARRALNQQKILNQDYRQSTYSTLMRLRTFEQAVKEVNAAEDMQKVELLLEGIIRDFERGEFTTALANTELAVILQQGIIQKHGLDNEEQKDRLNEVLVLKDTVASAPAFHRIRELREQTRAALRARNAESYKELIPDWSRETGVFLRRHKLSRLLEDVKPVEVELLYKLRAEIPSILEMVHGNLETIPGANNRKLYKTEVPQALYESVTGMNPSTGKDSMKPVDSITWEEAEQFNKLLSMILVYPVSLPDMATFKAALGKVDGQSLRSQSWASENSNRMVQECGKLSSNSAGFHDLLGNVAEWLDSTSDKTDSVVAVGGSARDSSTRLSTIPEDFRSRDERNRYIGFRFVVDLSN